MGGIARGGRDCTMEVEMAFCFVVNWVRNDKLGTGYLGSQRRMGKQRTQNMEQDLLDFHKQQAFLVHSSFLQSGVMISFTFLLFLCNIQKKTPA